MQYKLQHKLVAPWATEDYFYEKHIVCFENVDVVKIKLPLWEEHDLAYVSLHKSARDVTGPAECAERLNIMILQYHNIIIS